MAKQKQGSYLEELQKIELEIDALERKKKNLLSRKKDEDMKALAAFLEQNGISAEDAMEMALRTSQSKICSENSMRMWSSSFITMYEIGRRPSSYLAMTSL